MKIKFNGFVNKQRYVAQKNIKQFVRQKGKVVLSDFLYGQKTV